MWTVQAVENKATVSYYSGRTMKVRGFQIYNANARRWGKGFIQGTAQKWTPALEAKLKADAEAFAKYLNESKAA